MLIRSGRLRIAHTHRLASPDSTNAVRDYAVVSKITTTNNVACPSGGDSDVDCQTKKLFL